MIDEKRDIETSHKIDEQGVETIEYSAMTRDNRPAVLHASLPLEHRFAQIAKESGDRQNRATQKADPEGVIDAEKPEGRGRRLSPRRPFRR